MIQDSSPDYQDTWAFLDNRIQDVVNMATTAKQVESETLLKTHSWLLLNVFAEAHL